MIVLVKFHVFDLPPGFKDAELEIPDSATVNDVLDSCLILFDERGVSMAESELRTAIIMINGRWADLSDTVSYGDTVTIIRPMDGG